MNWYIGPWVWDVGEPGGAWTGPLGTFSAIDFRSLTDQGTRGTTDGQRGGGVGLFCSTALPRGVGRDWQPLGSGNWHDIKLPEQLQDALPKRPGYRLKGNDLVGMLFDLLTDGADPDGLEGPKPIMPGLHGRVELHCGQRYAERFQWGRGSHAGLVRDALQQDFADRWSMNQDHARRCLDSDCIKYRIDDWRELVPVALRKDVPGRLPHSTTYTDNFNRSDEALDANANWEEMSGVWTVTSNQAAVTDVASVRTARWTADLSSSDNYAQAACDVPVDTTRYSGVMARFQSTADTSYLAELQWQENKIQHYKRVAGVNTQIATAALAVTAGTPVTLKIECNGSTIKTYTGGVERLNTTDTAIATGLRGGLWAYKSAYFDDFEMADLGGGGGGILYTQLERTTRGYLRGTFQGNY